MNFRGIPLITPVEKMTVEKVKKSGKSSKKTEKFMFLDNLMNKIDKIDSEDQIPELFEEDELLKESFKSLLTLMGTEYEAEDEEGEDFDCDKVDENVMEIMEKFMKDGIIDEEEFEDFFTDELAEEDEEESDISEEDISEEDSVSEEESISEEDNVSVSVPATKNTKIQKTQKMTAEEKKKAMNMKELEMLTEKVEDESDFGTESEEEEDEEQEDDGEDENNFESSFDKKDIFEDEKVEGGRLSSFEKSQLALKTQIASLESEQLESQKPWALRGEINARQRPSDSLLEEAVDFDNLSRPTPMITEERTEEIEDIIRRRIGEAAWDDVERKDGRDLTLLNGMQNSNNSKPARPLLEDVATANPQRSLTQVYEDEAKTKLTGATAKDQETLDKQAELTALFAKICRHVDGLSGNRFAPKVYVQSDFQIKTLGGSKK